MNRASEAIHVKWAHDRNILGQGIGVAVLDTGICPEHPDFSGNRIIGFRDFINGKENAYDDNGHGTHVFGILGGDGKSSDGLYRGVAPACDMIGVKVLNHKGNGNIGEVLLGLKWVIENKERYHIRIVNISVGTTTKEPVEEDSVLVRAVNEVWDAGILVVVAAGNGGPNPKTIGAPGNSRKVITVGASDDDIVVDLFGSRMRDYSGRGPTLSCIKKPDIVAPGSNIVSCNLVRRNQAAGFGGAGAFRMPVAAFGNRNMKGVSYGNYYTVKSGTSMATPIVSGALALLLSKYTDMTNREVKIRLRNSAEDMGLCHEKQGWGLINVENLLSWKQLG